MEEIRGKIGLLLLLIGVVVLIHQRPDETLATTSLRPLSLRRTLYSPINQDLHQPFKAYSSSKMRLTAAATDSLDARGMIHQSAPNPTTYDLIPPLLDTKSIKHPPSPNPTVSHVDPPPRLDGKGNIPSSAENPTTYVPLPPPAGKY